MNVLYTATAHATGDGRNGHASSEDGILDVDLRIPKEMGGAGGAANPEKLFAAGYAACFHSALKVVGAQDKLDVDGTEVSPASASARWTAGGSASPSSSRSRPEHRPASRRGPRGQGARGLPLLQRHPGQHSGHPHRRL